MDRSQSQSLFRGCLVRFTRNAHCMWRVGSECNASLMLMVVCLSSQCIQTISGIHCAVIRGTILARYAASWNRNTPGLWVLKRGSRWCDKSGRMHAVARLLKARPRAASRLHTTHKRRRARYPVRKVDCRGSSRMQAEPSTTCRPISWTTRRWIQGWEMEFQAEHHLSHRLHGPGPCPA